MNKFFKSLLASSTAAVLGVSSVSVAQTATKVERPPQFVMLAFDGSFNIDFWKETRAFAERAKAEQKPLAWTYFISGVYWIHEANYALYVPPHKQAAYQSQAAMEADVQKRLADAANTSIPKETRKAARRGWSDIGFGNDVNDVAARMEQVSLAYNEGHEIASHANGHFAGGSSTGDSRKWNYMQWLSETDQFTDLIFNAYQNNKVENTTKYSSGYSFGVHDITGFRAPTLDTNKDMFQALSDRNYTYDTSGKNSTAEDPNRWPTRYNPPSNQMWVFPLGLINVAGTTKRTASMDYNFFVVQSKGLEDKANKEKYRDQMLDSYRKYFNDNYYGNRAPVHIGHHFSKWNGGAYWEAMQSLALEVCGMPEVRCVTYQEYVRWMNDHESNIKDYATGNFEKVVRPANLKSLAVVGETKPVITLENGSLKASAEMDRLSKVLSYKLGLKVNNKLQSANSVKLAELRKSSDAGAKVLVSAVVLNAQGDEMNSYTVKVNNIGTKHEVLDLKALEDRAGLGDLSEAHEHDRD